MNEKMHKFCEWLNQELCKETETYYDTEDKKRMYSVMAYLKVKDKLIELELYCEDMGL